jgi:predicted nucleic acid-binding protein
MAHLVDTSVLGRLANLADRLHATATQAIAELHQRGEVLHITPQNLIEFRGAATRPTANNGLGMTSAETEAKSSDFEAIFPLLAETPAIFPAWKALVKGLGVIGKQVHDARLVAVCHVHGVTHILTFNTSHFARLAGFGPGIIVVDPANV